MKEESFENSLKKLESIVKELENGEIDLDKSISKFKEATELVNMCSEKLKNANETVNKILGSSGTLEDFTAKE